MTILLSYRNNDLFDAYLSALNIKATEKIIFPKGTKKETIGNRMSNIRYYDAIICDYTVYKQITDIYSHCKNVKVIDSIFNRAFAEVFNVTDTEEGFVKSFKKLLSILNQDNKPIALVKEHLCDHLFFGQWFKSRFTCYRKSKDNPAQLEHFVPEEGYSTWKESKEWKEVSKEFESQGVDVSPWGLNQMSVNLIIDFLQQSCSFKARIVETPQEVKDDEFMIVDRHADGISRSSDVMVLPIETAVEYARQGAIVNIEKSKIQEALRKELGSYT